MSKKKSSRNFGLESRNMGSAVGLAQKQSVARKAISFQTAHDYGHRFAIFIAFAKENGIGRLERISREVVIEYGLELAHEVLDGEITASYAQDLVSAVNSVMNTVTWHQWVSVSPTMDCGIPRVSHVRADAPTGYDRDSFAKAAGALVGSNLGRQACVAELARELGIRSKEASLLDCSKALGEARHLGHINISKGTKGGRHRTVPITMPSQIDALIRASAVQGKNRNLIPKGQTWKQWRQGGLRTGREALQVHGISRLHDLRASYACERYLMLTGWLAPVLGGRILDKAIDFSAREAISNELGHGRIDVVASYVGGRK